MKFVKSSRRPQKAPTRTTSGPGLKSLVLVDRLVVAQQKSTPVVKKRANPGTRLLRFLGLKKKKAKLEVDPAAVMSVITPPSSKAVAVKPPFVVPLRYEPDPVTAPARSARPSRASRQSATPRTVQVVALAPSHPAPHTDIAAATQPVARPAGARPRPPVPQQRIPTERVQVIRPKTTSIVRCPPTAASCTVPRTVSVARNNIAPPRAASAGLEPFRLGNRIMAVAPAPATATAPTPNPSVAPQATASRPARPSRIPRYIGRRVTAPISFAPGSSCALCGSPESALGRPLSDVSLPPSGSSPSHPQAAFKLSPSTSLVASAHPISGDEAALPEPKVETPRKASVEIAIQTDSEEDRARTHGVLDERVTVDRASTATPPATTLSTTAGMKTARSGLIAALKARQAMAASGDVSVRTDSTTGTKGVSTPSTPWNKTKRETSALLDELKDRLARRKSQTTTASPHGPTATTSAASAKPPNFGALRPRRAFEKENSNAEAEEGELLQLFRRRRSDGVTRVPLGALNMNTGSGSSSQTVVGVPKVRRVVVPPVNEWSVPSRDPRILSELDRLRAQGKVGGGKRVGGLSAERC
ncbi:hypothetical protein C8R44DRAFT_853339 [Mycena epipterygia]|nr:hypothetical protein C8R44DRAFT_853339 [Mycena epipterygia]